MATSYHLIHTNSLYFKVKKAKKSLNPRERTAVAKMFSNQRRVVKNKKTCPVIFFRSGSKLSAVQRCDNRHTFKSAAFKSAAKKRANKLCHKKSGKGKGQFVRCR